MEHDQTSAFSTDPEQALASQVPTSRTDFDSPWKEAIEQYFQDFLAFFFPAMHAGIDWNKGYEFLDKELERVVHDAMLGRRYADKLVKVFLPDGHETWLWIYIEVQGYPDTGFRQRMFVYHYRILTATAWKSSASPYAPTTCRPPTLCRIIQRAGGVS